jgi:hypothetical protein
MEKTLIMARIKRGSDQDIARVFAAPDDTGCRGTLECIRGRYFRFMTFTCTSPP